MEAVGGNWIKNRETQLKDITKKGKILTFQELSTHTGFAKIGKWRYGQLCHFVRSLPGPIRDEKDYRPIEKLFLRETQGRNISMLYKILASGEEREIPPFIKKWEKELGTVCSTSSLGNILGATHGSAVDLKMIETNYKYLARWYATPDKLSKFQLDKSPNCWRSYSVVGTMAHLWWDCPIIKKYWQELIQLIEKIMGIAIPVDSWVCLFHGSEELNRRYKLSITPVLLNSAKSLIPKKWQEAMGPSIREWIARVNETYILEKTEDADPSSGEGVDSGAKWAKWEAFKKIQEICRNMS